MMSVKWNWALILLSVHLHRLTFGHVSMVVISLQVFVIIHHYDITVVIVLIVFSLSLCMVCAADSRGERQRRLHMSMDCSSITLLLLTLHLLGMCVDPSNMCHAIPADACTVHQLPSRYFCGLWIAAFPCPLLPFVSVLCCLSFLSSAASRFCPL